MLSWPPIGMLRVGAGPSNSHKVLSAYISRQRDSETPPTSNCGLLTMSEHDLCQEGYGPLFACMMGSFPGDSNHRGVSNDLAPTKEYDFCKPA